MTILVSEIGDKTFFLTMILAARRGRLLAVLASVAALWVMTMLSASIGFMLRSVPKHMGHEYWVTVAAAVLMIIFGLQSFRDLAPADAKDECADAQDEAACEIELELKKTKRQRPIWDWFRFAVLIFLAEWGDRSMLATVTLAATRSPVGTVLGGCAGHLVASLLAVASSELLEKYISDRTMKIIGGTLFIAFGVTTLFGIY